MRQAEQSREADPRALAAKRFRAMLVVTGDHRDKVSTARLRVLWWLAHQDYGVAISQKERSQGPAYVLEHYPRTARGRGTVKGVLEAWEVWEEADPVVEHATDGLEQAVDLLAQTLGAERVDA